MGTTCAPQKYGAGKNRPGESVGCARLIVVTAGFRRQLLSGPRYRRERILMVQAAEHWLRAHARTRGQGMPGLRRSDRSRATWRVRYTRTQRTVWASAVVVDDPLSKDRAQMRVCQWNQPIQHSLRIVPNTRSQIAFASGEANGDRSTVIPSAWME